MTPLGVAAAASVGLGLAGASGLFVRVPSRLAPRVRPYVAVSRSRLGRPADLAAPTAGRHGSLRDLVRTPTRSAARRLSRLIEARGDEHLELRLAQAGLDATADDYRVQMVVHGVGHAAIAFLAVLVVSSPALAIFAGVVGFAGGTARVRGRLDRSIGQRAERMRHELATVNQLLAMHLRTGAGPMQAIQRIVDRGRGVVVDDLAAVVRTARHGMTEAEAFRRVAERTAEPSAARTYQMFAAGAERGADLADALLAAAEDIRDAHREELRRNAVRRRAAMLVPTIAILAPIMLLFIAAPLPAVVFGTR